MIVTNNRFTFVIAGLAMDKYSTMAVTSGAMLTAMTPTVVLKVTPSPPGFMFGSDG